MTGQWPPVRQPGSGSPLAPTEDAPAAPVAPPAPTIGRRTITLTPASSINVRPVRWAWADRVPVGSLTLIAGREGIGKSTVGYSLAADITRGRLLGVHAGQPRGVLVCATEDSWSHTVVPRLMAADADLDRVFRVDVVTAEGNDTGLSLPRDLLAVERAVADVDAAVILLDPLMSRLDAALDTHKDSQVRLALEPLTALADRTGAAVLGVIHLNKGAGNDALTSVMGSRAFAAVARAVLYAMVDPESESTRLLGQAKNNLGRSDLPTLTFKLESAVVAQTDEGPVTTARLCWLGETDRTISEALTAAGDDVDARSAVAEAGLWLLDYLVTQGGEANSKDVKKAAASDGHTADALKRARTRVKVTAEAFGFPRQTRWSLPASRAGLAQSEHSPEGSAQSGHLTVGASPGETRPTALTHPTGQTTTPVCPVGAVGAVGGDPPRDAPTVGIGPCVRRCGRSVVRYGPGADALLCPDCRAAS